MEEASISREPKTPINEVLSVLDKIRHRVSLVMIGTDSKTGSTVGEESRVATGICTTSVNFPVPTPNSRFEIIQLLKKIALERREENISSSVFITLQNNPTGTTKQQM